MIFSQLESFSDWFASIFIEWDIECDTAQQTRMNDRIRMRMVCFFAGVDGLFCAKEKHKHQTTINSLWEWQTTVENSVIGHEIVYFASKQLKLLCLRGCGFVFHCYPFSFCVCGPPSILHMD